MKPAIRKAYICKPCLDVHWELVGYHNSLPQWRFCLECNGELDYPEPDTECLDSAQMNHLLNNYVDYYCARAMESDNWEDASRSRASRVYGYLSDLPEPQRVYVLRGALQAVLRSMSDAVRYPIGGDS